MFGHSSNEFKQADADKLLSYAKSLAASQKMESQKWENVRGGMSIIVTHPDCNSVTCTRIDEKAAWGFDPNVGGGGSLTPDVSNVYKRDRRTCESVLTQLRVCAAGCVRGSRGGEAMTGGPRTPTHPA